jgi:hypothetical protein
MTKRYDDSGFLMNIGLMQILGFILFTVCSASVYAHNADIGAGTILATIFEWSWLIVGLAVGLFLGKHIQDPRLVICMAIVAMLVWAFVVMK